MDYKTAGFVVKKFDICIPLAGYFNCAGAPGFALYSSQIRGSGALTTPIKAENEPQE